MVKEVCEINKGRKHTEPGSVTGMVRKRQCDSKEAGINNKEAGEDDEEEKNDKDGHEKNTALLHPTKKRSRPAARQKLPAKRDTKRRRFLS